jgi:UDP-glucose 4-epimerase
MNEQKPALVTGGCGFVGRHLIKGLLERGYREIWIVDDLSTGTHPRSWLSAKWQEAEEGEHTTFSSERGTLHFIHTDAQQFLLEEAATPSKLPAQLGDVVHLASIVGGRSLIDGDPIMVAKDLGIDAAFFFWLTRNPLKVERALYASSSAAYPISLQGEEGAVALKESDIDFSKGLGVPDMTYGWSKMTGEYLSRLAHKNYGIHIACVRPFSGFGEDQDLTYPTPSIALRVARGDDPIEVWGTGEQGRDFIHIDNCIDACFAILDKVRDGAGVNIGTGSLTSFNTLIREMLKLEGKDAVIKPLIDKPVGVNARYADITYLTETIGWKPKLTLEEGLKLVLEGARARLNGTNLPFTLE